MDGADSVDIDVVLDAIKVNAVDTLSEVTTAEEEGNIDDVLDVCLVVDVIAGDDASNNDEDDAVDVELLLVAKDEISGTDKLIDNEKLPMDVVVPGTKLELS